MSKLEKQTQKKAKNWIVTAAGFTAGLINGLFGSGGGMVAVPLLGYCGIEPKSTHATSVAVILPLSIASGLLYYTKGSLDFMQALPYLPGGILGALLGGWLMPKIKVTWLKRVFGLLILYSALRILMQ